MEHSEKGYLFSLWESSHRTNVQKPLNVFVRSLNKTRNIDRNQIASKYIKG